MNFQELCNNFEDVARVNARANSVTALRTVNAMLIMTILEMINVIEGKESE